MYETTFIGTKIAAAFGGLFGGTISMVFMKPITLLDAAIRGGISTGTAIIGSTLMIDTYDWPNNSIEYHVIAGAIIGFFAWAVLSMFGRFFVKAENKQLDIVDVAAIVKNPEKSPPVTTIKVRKKRAVKKH